MDGLAFPSSRLLYRVIYSITRTKQSKLLLSVRSVRYSDLLGQAAISSPCNVPLVSYRCLTWLVEALW